MARRYRELIGDRPQAADATGDRLTGRETEFISERDSFYIASVLANGWPYVQHRGGPKGFLTVIDDRTLGFADFGGNRQYVTVGNTGRDDRVALFLMDYPGRRRLKLMARAELVDGAERPELLEALGDLDYQASIERLFLLHVEAFDWNCPQHITRRFAEDDVARAILPLTTRIEELEARLAVAEGRSVPG